MEDQPTELLTFVKEFRPQHDLRWISEPDSGMHDAGPTLKRIMPTVYRARSGDGKGWR